MILWVGGEGEGLYCYINIFQSDENDFVIGYRLSDVNLSHLMWIAIERPNRILQIKVTVTSCDSSN